MTYKIEKDNVKYELGAIGVNEAGLGDVIKVGPNRLEIITEISPLPGSEWNKQIKTQSGRVYNMWDVLAYGRRAN